MGNHLSRTLKELVARPSPGAPPGRPPVLVVHCCSGINRSPVSGCLKRHPISILVWYTVW